MCDTRKTAACFRLYCALSVFIQLPRISFISFPWCCIMFFILCEIYKRFLWYISCLTCNIYLLKLLSLQILWIKIVHDLHIYCMLSIHKSSPKTDIYPPKQGHTMYNPNLLLLSLNQGIIVNKKEKETLLSPPHLQY